MVASTASELRENNTFVLPEPSNQRLLRSAVIYGPNASGKSNLIKAINFMQHFLWTSFKDSQEGESINVEPFRLDVNSPDQPCEFEVMFIQEGVRYQYGFSVTKTRVTSEWLIAYPGGRAQRWFERTYDQKNEEETWYFGSKFKGNKNVLQEATRSNALFFSTAVQLNNEQLKPVYKWFQEKLRVINARNINDNYSKKLCISEDEREKIVNFLNSADISITGVDVKMEKVERDNYVSGVPQNLLPFIDEILKSKEGKEYPKIRLLHSIAGTSEKVALNFRDESDGTKRLFALAGPWLDVLKNAHVIFVDELNASMHPLMTGFLVSLIHNPRINKNNAQLIFSTHDTTLLDNEIFRRDQIWFMEKDKDNATKLYPLTDFTPRKGEALEKGYLKGRYGAIPFIGELHY
jgi:AAA15 family ATPase/GTPase